MLATAGTPVLFRGLASEAREGSAFLARFKETMSASHLAIIMGREEVPDMAKFDALIASGEQRMDALAVKRAQSHGFTTTEEADYLFWEAKDKNLRERKKLLQERYTTMVEAADAALAHFRLNSGPAVHDVLRTIGVAENGNRLEQVRKFIAHVKAKWMGDPAFIRQQIDASLHGIQGAETRLDLETMSNLVDKYRLEQKVHFDENPRAAAAGQIRSPQTEVEYVQFILERVSSDPASELRTFRDWLVNEGSVKPRTMTAVKERIGLVCQVKAQSLQARKAAELKQLQATSTSALAATASVSELTRQIAYLQGENDQQQVLLKANAAVGMDGGNLYVRGQGRGAEARQPPPRNPGIGWTYQGTNREAPGDREACDDLPEEQRVRDTIDPLRCTFWDGKHCSYWGVCSRSNTHVPGVDGRPEHIRLAAQFGGHQPANKRLRREEGGY